MTPGRDQCPSFLELVRCEAGQLAEAPRARIRSHAGACHRCGGMVCDIRGSRYELLGATPGDRCAAAYRAALVLLSLADQRPPPS